MLCNTSSTTNRIAPAHAIGSERGYLMLRLAIVFLVIALIAGLLGVTGVAAVSSEIAWVLFVIFLILFLVSLIAGGWRWRSPL